MKPRFESVNLLFCLLVLLMPAMAKADPLAGLKQVEMQYSIYLGGLHILDSAAHFDRKDKNYTIQMKVGTQGMLQVFAPWEADLKSNGRMEKGAIRPISSTMITRWKDEPKQVTMNFAKSGKVEARFMPPDNSKHEAVPDTLMKDVMDPLSGIVQVMTSFAYGKNCQQVIPLFDGHRRFDLVLYDSGMTQIKGDDYSVYSGPAQRCEAVLKMRAGSRKDREGSRFWEDAKGQSSRPAIYLYLAKVSPELPMAAVRAETKTPFGNVVIHLRPPLKTGYFEQILAAE